MRAESAVEKERLKLEKQADGYKPGDSGFYAPESPGFSLSVGRYAVRPKG